MALRVAETTDSTHFMDRPFGHWSVGTRVSNERRVTTLLCLAECFNSCTGVPCHYQQGASEAEDTARDCLVEKESLGEGQPRRLLISAEPIVAMRASVAPDRGTLGMRHLVQDLI